MMTPLRRLTEGRPHGGGDSSDQPRGPLTFGAGGDTQTQRGGAHRSLLPSAPRACPFVWSWRGGPAPGDARWSSCPLSGGGPLGGARDALLAPGWPGTRGAERLSPRPDARGAVYRAAQPGVWGHRTQCLGGLCPLDPLAPAGYDDDHPLWGL